jgi:formylglycine-generating enzyme required for sulfatase activity
MTVADLLARLNLAHLAPAFEAEGIDLEALALLDDAHLKELGVTRLGDRAKLREMARAGGPRTATTEQPAGTVWRVLGVGAFVAVAVCAGVRWKEGRVERARLAAEEKAEEKEQLRLAEEKKAEQARSAAEPARRAQNWQSPTFGTMQWIPAGTFTMGSPNDEIIRASDEAQHTVTLTRGFWLMEHEVTQGEWQAVMGSNPANFTACGPTCPVETVSREDAQAFVQKVSARDGVTYALPTEAQWEYAARGGQAFVYAGSNTVTDVAWVSENAGSSTHPVCQKQRNGFGLCDMSGNVYEWTADIYGDYPSGAVTDPVGAASGPLRVRRGGSWRGTAVYARAAYRSRINPGNRLDFLGLRLSRTIP